ncbi:SEC-C metal-binding domain-containing protein (plasmid) [Lysinibacillus capsici]|uniref:SEC-C metal-binding domain-containing protein n=1 Tax=Lysinibacillus capsici TaxID=2115968 RepID=UPI0021D93BCC|nr:SEC-C metal-binding domain-containing protein [Lysinibacillus capsici]UYB50126.1 SEC-C metal-binding domain-containing protein [Lysinibacillus capsici]
MLTTYLQDQYNLYQQNQKDNLNNLYTGFESYVSNIKYEKLGENHDLKISAVENFDATVEIINLIITYLYYLKEDEINTGANVFEKVSPYFDVSFEEVLYLGQQRWILAGLWEKIKFNHWKIELDKTTESKEDVFIYLPENMNLDKANFYGINRINYQAISNIGLQAIQKQKEMDVSFKKMEHFFSSNPSLEQILNMEIQYYNAFKLFSETALKVEKIFIDDYYYKISFNGINLKMILEFIKYMMTISLVLEKNIAYKNKALDDDYSFLTPVIGIENLGKAFSNISGYSLEECDKLVKIFTFGLKENKGQDIFSKPLIYCGNQNVVLVPYLYTHLNITKAIQEWIKQTKVKIAEKGFSFEEKVTNAIKSSPYIKINTNKMEFEASDGKKIEYDLLCEFNNNILIIEFKNMFVPYTDKDLGKSFDIIHDGVEQLKRREKILFEDIRKINELCSFKIDENFDRKKVIKILCTNVYHFTPLNIEEVIITDYSTLIKFFNNPETRATSFKKSEKNIEARMFNYDNPWKNEIPTIEDLKLFLKNPASIKLYKDKVRVQFKPIYRTNKEDANICYSDRYFIVDPYKIEIPNFKNATSKNNRKVGRNEPCICGSGRKYKKCYEKNLCNGVPSGKCGFTTIRNLQYIKKPNFSALK